MIKKKSLLAALCLLIVTPIVRAQTATINWTDVHQTIDGFGASNAFYSSSMTSAQQAFFFGQGPGQLGLSILRVAIPDNGGTSATGNCTTVGTSCAGPVVGDMQAAVAEGARIYATPWSPPPLYKSNGSTTCNAAPGNGQQNFAILSSSVAPSNVSENSWLYTFNTNNATAASNAWAGLTLNFSGYTGSATGNNGTFAVTASTSTSVTVTNATGTTVNTGTGNVNFFTPQAVYLANFVQSLAALSPPISLYAISAQNEPDNCPASDGALANNVATAKFINVLGPLFSTDGISTLIFQPETSKYANITGSNGGAQCATTSCATYLGGYNWHDYDAVLSGTNTVTADPVPAGWATGLKWWETEASCGYTFGPSWCSATPFNPSITDALNWAAVIDQRIAGDNANAWLWWGLLGTTSDNQGLTGGTTIAQRAYALAQYAKFIRPGYLRIDATRQPQTGLSVSAYQNASASSLVIVATNYTASPISQTFSITNAPTFTSVTPTITSATQSLQTLSSVAVSSNSFTYSVPAQSIVTFVAAGQAPNSFYGMVKR